MAGGKEQVTPLYYYFAKTTIPINNKPMIEHVMEKLIKYEFKKFYITLGYKGDLIKTYLKEKYKNVAFIFENL